MCSCCKNVSNVDVLMSSISDLFFLCFILQMDLSLLLIAALSAALSGSLAQQGRKLKFPFCSFSYLDY